jgi:hypothetical protein
MSSWEVLKGGDERKKELRIFLDQPRFFRYIFFEV